MQYLERVAKLEQDFYAQHGRCFTLTTLLEFPDTPPFDGDTFGKWFLDTSEPPSLAFGSRNGYWIKLSDLMTDSGLMEWLNHLHGKKWFRQNPENAGNFLLAVLTIRKQGFVRARPVRKSKVDTSLTIQSPEFRLDSVERTLHDFSVRLFALEKAS